MPQLNTLCTLPRSSSHVSFCWSFHSNTTLTSPLSPPGHVHTSTRQFLAPHDSRLLGNDHVLHNSDVTCSPKNCLDLAQISALSGTSYPSLHTFSSVSGVPLKYHNCLASVWHDILKQGVQVIPQFEPYLLTIQFVPLPCLLSATHITFFFPRSY